MKRIAPLLFFLLLTPVVAQAQSFLDEKELNNEVDRLLRSRDVGELASEIADRKPATLRDELKAIVIFARAGHPGRVREAMKQLGSRLPEDHQDRYHIIQIVQKAMDHEDLASQVNFYEQFAPGGDANTSRFIALWKKSGDIRELESWLAVRSRGNETWWRHLYEIKTFLGTSEEMTDELAAEVRANPNDLDLLRKYVGIAGPTHDVSWVADLIPADSSYRRYELALIIHNRLPDLAIKLLEASLDRPFTSADRTIFTARAFRYASIAPAGINAEKQLRYWTIKLLARIHYDAGRSHLAQPYAERLTAMDTSDIQTDNQFGLAGAVQAASGQRFVESRILRNEATDRERPQYWIERASYYDGRGESDAVLTTYREALKVFPYSRTGEKDKRLRILFALAMLYDRSTPSVIEAFRTEIDSTRGDAQYQFEIWRSLLSADTDWVGEYFVNTTRLGPVLDSQPVWRDDAERLLVRVLNHKKWDKLKREAVLRDVVRLASGRVRERAFALATALVEMYDYGPAIPLLEDCRKIAGDEYTGETNFTREDVERKLFEALIETGNWRKAKSMYDEGYSYWGNELGSIALAAAKVGDRDNAFRVWQINANLDRRKLDGLTDLSKTSVKPSLRDFYSKMQRRDPMSNIPARALALLN